MRIGSRTHDFGSQTIKELPRLLKKNRIEAAQIVLPKGFEEMSSYEEVTEERLQAIKESFREVGVDIAILGCYMDLGNPDKEVRSVAVATFKKCLEYGKLLGAEIVATETAYPRLSQEEKRIWYPFMEDSIKQIVEAAEEIGQDMALEPVYWHPLESLAVTKEIFAKMNSKRLKMVFDPANVLEDTSINQDSYYKEWLDEFGEVIEAIHMKDFVLDEKGEYQGVPLGTGVMKYDQITKWYKANRPGIVVIREELDPGTCAADIAYMEKIK